MIGVADHEPYPGVFTDPAGDLPPSFPRITDGLKFFAPLVESNESAWCNGSLVPQTPTQIVDADGELFRPGADVLSSATANEARVTGIGLLSESAQIQLNPTPYSMHLWTPTNANLGTDVAPDIAGGTGLTEVESDSNATRSFIGKGTALAFSAVSVDVWIDTSQPGSSGYAFIEIDDGTGTDGVRLFYDLQAETVGSGSRWGTWAIDPFGVTTAIGVWRRIHLVSATPSAATWDVRVGIASSVGDDTSALGDLLYVYGANVTEDDTVYEYVSEAVTRGADRISYDKDCLPGVSDVTMSAVYTPNYTAASISDHYIFGMSVDADNYIAVLYFGLFQQWVAASVVAGTLSAVQTIGAPINFRERQVLGIQLDAAVIEIWVNGFKLATGVNLASALPDWTGALIDVGHSFFFPDMADGYLAAPSVYDRKLGDGEMLSLAIQQLGATGGRQK